MENHVLEFACTGIENGGIFPVEHTGRGLDVSPEFIIENLSANARTLAITLEDLTHPIKNFTHWVIWNIPAADRVTDPNKTIRDQISSIVAVFELPKLDNGGNPIQYLLGQIMDDGDEPEILEFEDEDGREQALIDYNIQPGDHLHLISVPIAG